MQYRLKIGSHGRFEDGVHRTYRRGDLIELSDAEVASFGDRVEPVPDAAPSAPEPEKKTKRGSKTAEGSQP